MAVIDLKHATVTLRDGTAVTPLTLEIKIGEGNLTYTEKRNMQYRRDRGNLNTVRQGDEEPVEVNFDFEWEFLKSVSGEPVTPEEALKKEGAASAWVSTSADVCEPYALDIVITNVVGCGTTKNEVIVLQDFRWESMDHNLKDGQVSVKGQCNVTEALLSRVAPSDVMSVAELPAMDSALPPRVNLEDVINVGRERKNLHQRRLQEQREDALQKEQVSSTKETANT
jgi:hypothetical protein